jgi:ABC-type Fe3+-hydroxamate transport system substrate-binding protein
VYQVARSPRRSTSSCSAAVSLFAVLIVALTEGCDAAPEPEPPPPVAVRNPHGIVSLSPEVSRILLELGVGGEVVAADAASGDLPGIGDPVDLGELEDASVARVAELAPDVAIGLADARTRAFALKLEALGIRVILLAPRNANEVDAAVLQIGDLVAREMRARVLAARTVREVSEIATRRDGRSRLRVAFVIRCDPPTVVGGAGLIHETLELAGAENVFHEPGLEERTITGSELAERAPEVVLDASGADPASPCFDETAWGARTETLPTRLATVPAMDLVARVRSLYEILYPGESVIRARRSRRSSADAPTGSS